MTPAAPVTGTAPRSRGSRRLLSGVVCGMAALLGFPRLATSEPMASPAILQELRAFHYLGSVLYVAAHPDDENTQLIAYLARGRHYRTAYLSVTRGDGGQNVLGPEFGEELGVIRTQELLAARRIDGGRQFFTRAIDFGFSKDSRETLNIWDRQQVLSDIVRVIRSFRPDVIITRFSPQPGGTHGHHTASAVLALEAFKLAGDPKAFPEQLREFKPWQPKRILLNSWRGFGRGGNAETNAAELRIDVDGNDPVSGESFGDIAARSRSMHKTQGFDNFSGFGGGGPRSESFQLLAGEPATNDILDGVDTTWNRVPGGAEIGRLTEEVITQFNPQDPSASVPALLRIRSLLAALPADRVVDEKRGQLDRILQACLGLSVETVVSQAEVVPGETLKLRHTAIVGSKVPVRWVAVRYPGLAREVRDVIELQANRVAARESTQTLPANTPLTQPYWLREEHPPGMYRVEDAALIGRPENPSAFPVEEIFEVGGQTLVIPDEPVQVVAGGEKGEIRRQLDVISPVSLQFASEVGLFAPGSARPVEVEVAALRAGMTGTLQLEAPAGWKVTPATQPFRLQAIGDRARFTFSVTAPAQPAVAAITARAELNGVRYANRRVEIRYGHIPPQLLQPPARLKAVGLELAIRGKRVGYVPGAGDSVADALEQMGYSVTSLTGADLTSGAVARARRRGDRHPRVQRPQGPRFAVAGAVRLRRSGRQRDRAIQQSERPADEPARAVRPAALSGAGDGRNRAGDVSGARSSGAEHAEQDHERGFRGLGAGARAVFPEPMGRALHADPRVRRSRRGTAQGRPAGCAIRQGVFRVYRARVVPATARGCARRLPPVCQPGFAGEMKPPPRDHPMHDETPGVPGFRTWRGIYVFVFVCFVLVVVLLALFSRVFA